MSPVYYDLQFAGDSQNRPYNFQVDVTIAKKRYETLCALCLCGKK